MRQHPHERTTSLPGRCMQHLHGWSAPHSENQQFPYRENFMQLREPPFFNFMHKRPEFIGLLGSAPINVPPDVHPMMWPPKHPMTAKNKGNSSQHRCEKPPEMERSSLPPGVDDFVQMAWRTGIQRDRSIGHSCSNPREGTTKSSKKHRNRRRKKTASPPCHLANSRTGSGSVSNKLRSKEGTSDRAHITEKKSLFEELEEGEIGMECFPKSIDVNNEIVDISSDSADTEIRNISESNIAYQEEMDTGSSRLNDDSQFALTDTAVANQYPETVEDKINIFEGKQTSSPVDVDGFPNTELIQHVNTMEDISLPNTELIQHVNAMEDTSLQPATSEAQSPEEKCCSHSGETPVALTTCSNSSVDTMSSLLKFSIPDHGVSCQNSNSIADKRDCSIILDINIPISADDQRRNSTVCASTSSLQCPSYRKSQDICFNGDEGLSYDPIECDRKHSRCDDNLHTISKKPCLNKVISLTCTSNIPITDNVSTSEIQNNAVIKDIHTSEHYPTRIPDLNLSHSENDLDCEAADVAATTSYFSSLAHSEIKNPVKLRMKLRDPRRVFLDREKSISNNFSAVAESSASSSSQSTRDDSSLNQSTTEDISLHKAGLPILSPQDDERKPVQVEKNSIMSHPKSRYKKMNMPKSVVQNPHPLDTVDAKLREERIRRIEEQNKMLNARKLSLVLDLDHTLLNSAKFSEMDEELEVMLSQMNAMNRQNEGSIKDLYRLPEMGMWTKLRPGVREFLARASQLYELHVSTMGNKAYAMEMTKLLDPTGTLFAGRVISRGDDVDCLNSADVPHKSKDLEGVLGLESAVLIIDDSIQVWPHHRLNLLEVERYMYFPSTRRQFNLPGPSLLEIRHDERAVDGMLASVLKVIEKIHYAFFSAQSVSESDVRCILAAEKKSVLAGCKIVFSRVYPQGESQPHLYPLWQKAEEFGAVCTMSIDDSVTHVVAISRGTDKVKWAMQSGRFCVSPGWLEASAILYRRANENDFPVPP